MVGSRLALSAGRMDIWRMSAGLVVAAVAIGEGRSIISGTLLLSTQWVPISQVREAA